jgi:hypothetical protein
MFSNWRMDGFPQRDAQDCTAPSIAVNAAFSNFAIRPRWDTRPRYRSRASRSRNLWNASLDFPEEHFKAPARRGFLLSTESSGPTVAY